MKQNKTLKITLSTLFLVLLLSTFFVSSPLLAQEPVSDVLDYVPGEILVKFKPELNLQDQQQKAAELNGLVVRRVEKIEVLQVKVPEGRELVTIERLRAQENVAFATLNYRVYATETPNDPGYYLQWALAKIGAPQAWDTSTGSHQVIIAVVDSGVDLDHPDLQANLVAGYDYVNDDAFPDDDNGHGTHVAGIAAAMGDNGQGISGLNWQARVMPLKILNASGDGNVLELTQAILDAANGGARIINMSLGGSCLYNDWSPVQQAIDYAVSKGVLLVAASGNEGASAVLCPAGLDHVLAVGSTTESDFRSYFSNYGSQLDVVAPGSNIYSTVPYGSYGYKSGTSMATPYVTGLAALLWSVNPQFSPDTVAEIIRSTADDLGASGWDAEYGYGRINAERALLKLQNLQLTDAQGQNIVSPISFLMDDATLLPLTAEIYITTSSPKGINWTASVESGTPWLAISPPGAGQVSAASKAPLILSVTRPPNYGTYTASVVVQGTTASGGAVEPKTVEIQVTYVAQLQRLQLPLILK